jgi:hypothetical protein
MVLCLSQDGACTDSFENFRDNSLKGGLTNYITLTPPLFSLENTFKPSLAVKKGRSNTNLTIVKYRLIIKTSLHSQMTDGYPFLYLHFPIGHLFCECALK